VLIVTSGQRRMENLIRSLSNVVGKLVLVDLDVVARIEAECQRLGTSDSDFIREALIRLRAAGRL
jgi:hypothetical protein